ncbi:MAG: metallophosphoesterase family protein [Thermomicrobiales bacterium]
MRLAILSDVHGNTTALDAVLADVEAAGGVDGYWVLGDHAALGPDPTGAIERLVALPNAQFVRGNTDRYTATGDRPEPTPEDVLADPAKLPIALQVAASFAWTQGAVTAAGQLNWLAALPLEQRLTFPDGTRLLGVHAAPGEDDGPGINPGQSDDELATILGGSGADLVIVGHTHVALDRTAGGVRVINLGSVSNPVTEDLRAGYLILEVDASGYRLERRRVAYDIPAVMAAVERARHPASPFLLPFFRGERRSRWA